MDTNQTLNPLLVPTKSVGFSMSLSHVLNQIIGKEKSPVSGLVYEHISDVVMAGLLSPDKVSLKTLTPEIASKPTTIKLNPQLSALVLNYAAKHGYNNKSALNQLLLTGLHLEGFIDPNTVVKLPKGPTFELGLEHLEALRHKAQDHLDNKKPKVGRGRPEGRGKQCSLHLPESIISWLDEYHGRAGKMVERSMLNLLLEEAEWADLRPILPPIESTPNKQIVMHLQPWQMELIENDMAHTGGSLSLSFLRLLQTARTKIRLSGCQTRK